MKAFFQDRLKKHQKHMMRYMQYVLNDHFVLIMFFLLGGIGFYYSNWLKTLTPGYFLGAIVTLIIWIASLHIGRFVSLAHPADQIFLLPKEKQMRTYLSSAFSYSCIFPFFVLLFILAFTMPLVVVSTGKSFITFFFYLFSLWGLKISHLEIERMSIFQDMKKARKNAYFLWLIFTLIILALSLWLQPILGTIISIAQVVLFHKLCWQTMDVPLDWEEMINEEQSRLHRIYQFINLFTDVPEISTKIKRRKYLDPLLKRISFNQTNTYLYLYARRVLRGNEYGGLYVRLLLIGGVLLYFVGERWFALGIGALFIYLIGFQLLPLYQQYQYVPITKLYPLKEKQKLVAMKKLLRLLLFFCAVVFIGIVCFSLSSWSDRLIVSVGYLLMTFFFVEGYVPYRLKKMAN
ncbi:ABC transporter permease [Tetragenococcus muriaticus]|uniref:Permease component of an ABC superfamily transporter n=2 Tax=Tetragenococcus muriaticus TaxID=64642 RepID=A0A091BZ36_9ENTE|nr:ABC transporter permease [Tetragenococcus muriaticus]KFN89730.1 permease component of an ABC superfamily transporter [Tetragenococcus muriaticus 3MR10-3]GMA47883.1 ABC transporter [Tetragenococcus muriaticus]